MENNQTKRQYKVIVADSKNEILELRNFLGYESAIFLFMEFQKKYPQSYKIIIEAILL